MSGFPGTLRGPIFHGNLEYGEKTMALRHNEGGYQARVKVSQESLTILFVPQTSLQAGSPYGLFRDLLSNS